MHLLAQGAPSTIHCTVGMRGTRGLRWGPHVRPTSDSSGRRTLAWRPQAISTVICGGGDIWKVQKVRNKRGPLKEERQPLTPGLQQTDRQTDRQGTGSCPIRTALHTAPSSSPQDKSAAKAQGRSQPAREPAPRAPKSTWAGWVHLVDSGWRATQRPSKVPCLVGLRRGPTTQGAVPWAR